MQFDFTLAANGGMNIETAGRFVKYVGGVGKIRVRFDKGGYIDLLPGQGATGLDFSRLTIEDRSGAANVGVLLAGAFAFQDDRISGEVSVIDGGKSRSLSEVAFVASRGIVGSAGQYPGIQLLNPAGSGKRLIVQAFKGSCNVASNLYLVASLQVLGGSVGAAGQKHVKTSGTYGGIAQVRSESIADVPSNIQDQVFISTYVQAGGETELLLHEPIVLTPGTSLIFYNLNVASTLFASYEFFEDMI